MDTELQALALKRAPAEVFRKVAVRAAMTRLRDDGLEKVRPGPDLDRRDHAGHRQRLKPERAASLGQRQVP